MKRIAVCVGFGVLAGLYCYYMMTGGALADDFGYHWLAARAVMDGVSPYQAVHPDASLGTNAGYLYPLTATLVVLPFAWLSPIVAASAFMAVSIGLLSWGLTQRGYGRLAWLGGIPVFWAVKSGQMSALSTAGALIPGAGFLALLKPNIGLALFAYRPSKSMIAGGIALFVMSLIVLPTWPMEWMESVRGRTDGNYGVPVLSLWGGPLLLLAAFRWRRPEARLLLVMACVPQSLLFYDQLPLGLIARNRTEAMLLAVLSFAGWFTATIILPESADTALATARYYGPAIVATIYLPCLAMVLLRKNEDEKRAYIAELRAVSV